MAMAVEVQQYPGVQSGLIPRFPPQQINRYSSVGLTPALNTATRTVTLRNYGDTVVFFRLNADADTTQAAGGETQSCVLVPGDIFSFTLQPGWQSASTYKLDLR